VQPGETQQRTSGVNRRGSLHLAQSSGLPGLKSVGGGPFDDFRADAARPSPAAVGALNAAMASARTSDAVDTITDAWKAYMRGRSNDAAVQREMFRPMQHDADIVERGLRSAMEGDVGGGVPGSYSQLPVSQQHPTVSGTNLGGPVMKAFEKATGATQDKRRRR